MFKVICCNDYYLVSEHTTLDEAIEACRAHVDGTYGCYVTKYGEQVADAEGPFEPGEIYTDAATQTGMYDRF